ncbi:MAG: hypothetical protein C4547_12840 [Phycisphaerales bacterium]|nr:MAG: hypothetical protein C4547_12840 [Phycisphaerales bacterium]
MNATRYWTILAVLLVSAAASGSGTDYTWTGAEDSTTWKEPGNWLPLDDSGWPGQDPADTATVPHIQGDAYYPLVPLDTIELAALTLTYDQYGGSQVNFEPSTSSRSALIVTGRDGLVVGQSCTITIAKARSLQLSGGGQYVIDGVIDGGSTALLAEPHLVFGGSGTDDTTHVLAGTGSIRGSAALVLLPYSADNVVVLGYDNAIYGSVKVGVALVNHGVVDATIPGSQNGGHVLRLYCQPKVGDGDWKITGNENFSSDDVLLVDTPVAGSGKVIVGQHGILDVNVHFSVYGTMTMEPNATIVVAPGVMFDVDRFQKTGCPD